MEPLERRATPATPPQEYVCRIDQVGGEPAKPVEQCTIVLSYPPDHPDLVAAAFSGGPCADAPEVAMAIALATFLKAAAASATGK